MSNDAKPKLKLVTPKTPRAWDRLPNETPVAYEAFIIYRDDDCSLEDVAFKLSKSHQLVKRWSAAHHWVQRRAAWKDSLNAIDEQQKINELASQNKLWAQRKMQIREKGFEAGNKLIERALQLLALPVAQEVPKDFVETADGRKVPTTVILNFSQSPRDAIRMAEIGIKLQRLSADMTTENFLPRDFDLDNATDEEIDKYVEELERIRAKQVSG